MKKTCFCWKELKFSTYQNGRLEFIANILQSTNVIPRDVGHGGESLSFTGWLDTLNGCFKVALIYLHPFGKRFGVLLILRSDSVL